MAVEIADKEYEKYCEIQKKEANQLEPDFDKVVRQLKEKKAAEETEYLECVDIGWDILEGRCGRINYQLLKG